MFRVLLERQRAIRQMQTAWRQDKPFHTHQENGVRNRNLIIQPTAAIWRAWHGEDQLHQAFPYAARMTGAVFRKTVMVHLQAIVITP